MIGAYIAIIVGVVVWGGLLPVGRRFTEETMRSITVFGGAFLLGVCCLELLPEVAETFSSHRERMGYLPFVAILMGFLVQQVLDGLSAHAEHGHTEEGFTLGGLMLGLCLHAFLEGMPLVWESQVNQGLLWGIVVHNIPVAILMVGLMASRGYRIGQVLALLALFGIMSPLGSLCCRFVIQPDTAWQGVVTGLVVGVLLHVSSSILFDHKRNRFSWLSVVLSVAAFVAAALICLH